MTYFEGQSNLYDYIRKANIPDGDHTLNVNGVDIDIEMYNFEEDVTYSASPVLGNDTADSRMLVLNYKGNLIIDSGVVVTPQVRKKGMTIFVAKDLINNGTISMTARGAVAEGQDVYLYKNRDGTLEFIPAVGGAGGPKSTANGNYTGKPGSNGANRGTGGGGSGGSMGTNSRPPGRGGNGTSYSGGSGGGGVYHTSASGSYAGGDASDIGGPGGAGSARGANYGAYAAGGVGNGPGKSGWSTNTTTYLGNIDNTFAQAGTGGLLILFANNLFNNGKIESNGSSTVVNSKYNSNNSKFASGGNSGGGSINLFYKKKYEGNGSVIAAGGSTQLKSGLGFLNFVYGGDGGDGSITVQNILRTENLILNDNEYKTYEEAWIAVSDSPDQIDFETKGVLTEELNRASIYKKLSMQKESDRVFLTAISLAKYKDVLSVKTEVK